MSKKVLVIYYTQSGQLAQIVENFTAAFDQPGVMLEKVEVKPQHEFLFPWNSKRFFDAMPETVLGIVAPLKSFELKEQSYDLIIFAYQPWYLSPSIPANAILQHPAFKAVAKNTPVITLIGARNMWLNSQERVKRALHETGARLVGNVVRVDNNSNLISGVTILYWMMSGKKDRMWGIFPKPGVSDEDIFHAHKFGEIAAKFLDSGNWQDLQPALIREKSAVVKTNLMFIEPRATKLFSIWANFIIKRKNRSAWLLVFKYYLLIALFIIAPVVLLINNLLFRPFLGKSINKKKQYYSGIN